VNGDGSRTSSEMNTFGSATLRNVYYSLVINKVLRGIWGFEGCAPQPARRLACDYNSDRPNLVPELLRATQHALVWSTSSASPRTGGSTSVTRATFATRAELAVLHQYILGWA
jgi:hypothetical protein